MAAANLSAHDTAAHDGHPWRHLYTANVPGQLADLPALPLEAFEAALAAHPERPALHYFRSTLRYAQIASLATRLARRLSARGVRRGDRVAVLDQNTPATVIAVVATWRMGAAIVPLSPMLTSHELGYYLSDSGASAIIVGAEALPQLPLSIEIPVFVTSAHDFLRDDDTPAILTSAPRDPSLMPGWERMPTDTSPIAGDAIAFPTGEDLAFLTYTSGTTGKPKGAMINHANVAHSAEVYRLWLDLGANDVMLAAAPFSHITGLVAHIAAGFAAGMPIVVAYRFDAATVLDLIEHHGCTAMVASITAYVALLEHPSFLPARLRRFTKLYSGGAPVAQATVDRWEKATGVYIHNAYGLTETTSPSHLVPMGRRAPVDRETGALSVGVPVPGTDCRLLDERDGVGELLTRGPQVVSGYWRKPEETANNLADGWLRTGDICRRDAEGWFYIVDRAKDMIVASGFKVWPREVEDVLLAHPDVVEAAVIGVPDAYRGERPQAHVVLRPGAHVTADQIVAFARERLASYKVPKDLHFTNELPKTVSGKILRRLLGDRP